MSKIYIFITLLLITFTLSSKLQSKCIANGMDCDSTSYCCANLVCKDYRCSYKGTKENQVAWAPDGEKCDWFHHCGSNYRCESHRCVLKREDIIKALTKKIKDTK